MSFAYKYLVKNKQNNKRIKKYKTRKIGVS